RLPANRAGLPGRLLDPGRRDDGGAGEGGLAEAPGKRRARGQGPEGGPLMIPVIVVAIYLVIIGVIGSLAFRKSQANTEDFFLANRAVGSMVFFLSIF